MDLNTQIFESQELKCKICMGYYDDPVIGTDSVINVGTWPPEIYCEKCLILWNKTNIKSPGNGPKITKWFRIPEFSNLCLRSKIRTNQNLIKFTDPLHSIECADLSDALHILEMIDAENVQRIKNKDFTNKYIFKEIFKRLTLVQNIVQHIVANKLAWWGGEGWAISHYLCRFGTMEVIQYLLSQWRLDKKYVPMDHVNHGGYSPISYLFGRNNVLDSGDQLKLILDLLPGIDPEMKLHDSQRPIEIIFSSHMNSSHRLSAFKTMILTPGINLEHVMNDGRKLIHLVCGGKIGLESGDQLEAIKLLLALNVDIEAKDKNLWTPLHYVSYCDNHMNSSDQLQALKIMIEHKADVNAMTDAKWTSLGIVCGNTTNHFNSADQVRAIDLLFKTSDLDSLVNVKTFNDWSPFILVSGDRNNLNQSDQFNVMKMFVENKFVDLNIQGPDGQTSMHYICGGQCKMGFQDRFRCLELFVKEGQIVRWDSVNNSGKKPIDMIFDDVKLTSDQKLKLIRLLV
jgi:hypothetical protein